jgi:hypothetical protein
MNRRAWILGVAASWWSVGARAQQEPSSADQREIKEIETRAEKANLDQFRNQLTEHYLGIGNADPRWLADALKLCEGLYDDYLSHFRKKGFPANPPKQRLTVVALADPGSFAAFLGSTPDEAVGGEYDLDSNRLVIFDNRARDKQGQQARANTVSLMHEATHQLTFNTGLLDRKADVPAVISEGLGTYGETRRPRAQTKGSEDDKVGGINRLRLEVFFADRPPAEGEKAERQAKKKKAEPSWIPFKELLADDKLFTQGSADAQLLAYSHAWLTVHYLMHKPERTTQFQTYLKAIRKREDNKRRVEDAEAAFGDLEVLDKELRAYLSTLRARVRRR